MKNIAFALLVFGIPVLFPIYLVVELQRGVAKTVINKDFDSSSEETGLPIRLFSQRKTKAVYPIRAFVDKKTARNSNDFIKSMANTRHKRF